MNLSSGSTVELKEFLISIIGNAPFGIATIALDGYVTVTNSLALEHLIPSGETSKILGKRLIDVTKHIPELQEILLHIKNEGRINFDLDRVNIGEKIYSIKGRSIVNGMALVTADKTDEISALEGIESLNRNLEAVVEKRTKELNSLNADLSAFTSAVAHDLKSPLTSLMGYAELLASDAAALTDEQQLYARKIQETSTKMSVLIKNMLQSSRVSIQKLKKEKINLSDCASELLDGFKENDKQRVVDLQIESGCIAMADVEMIKIALSNLLLNAWKYSGKNKKAKIEFGKDKTHQAFFIKDNGVGVSPDDHESIFEVYTRAKNSNGFEGTGIGLSTVKRIIEKHEGQIWVESEEGKGATFYFQLP